MIKQIHDNYIDCDHLHQRIGNPPCDERCDEYETCRTAIWDLLCSEVPESSDKRTSVIQRFPAAFVYMHRVINARGTLHIALRRALRLAMSQPTGIPVADEFRTQADALSLFDEASDTISFCVKRLETIFPSMEISQVSCLFSQLRGHWKDTAADPYGFASAICAYTASRALALHLELSAFMTDIAKASLISRHKPEEAIDDGHWLDLEDPIRIDCTNAVRELVQNNSWLWITRGLYSEPQIKELEDFSETEHRDIATKQSQLFLLISLIRMLLTDHSPSLQMMSCTGVIQCAQPACINSHRSGHYHLAVSGGIRGRTENKRGDLVEEVWIQLRDLASSENTFKFAYQEKYAGDQRDSTASGDESDPIRIRQLIVQIVCSRSEDFNVDQICTDAALRTVLKNMLDDPFLGLKTPTPLNQDTSHNISCPFADDVCTSDTLCCDCRYRKGWQRLSALRHIMTSFSFAPVDTRRSLTELVEATCLAYCHAIRFVMWIAWCHPSRPVGTLLSTVAVESVILSTTTHLPPSRLLFQFDFDTMLTSFCDRQSSFEISLERRPAGRQFSDVVKAVLSSSNKWDEACFDNGRISLPKGSPSDGGIVDFVQTHLEDVRHHLDRSHCSEDNVLSALSFERLMHQHVWKANNRALPSFRMWLRAMNLKNICALYNYVDPTSDPNVSAVSPLLNLATYSPPCDKHCSKHLRWHEQFFRVLEDCQLSGCVLLEVIDTNWVCTYEKMNPIQLAYESRMRLFESEVMKLHYGRW